MRLAWACSRCRSKKIKCVHEGQSPCLSCKKKGLQLACRLTSTKEFRVVKQLTGHHAVTERNSLKTSHTFEMQEKQISCVYFHHPELLFLKIPKIDQLLHPGVKEALFLLSCKYTGAEIDSIALSQLEAKVLELANSKSDYLSCLQLSLILILIFWQLGSTRKAWFIEGIASRISYYLVKNKEMAAISGTTEKEVFTRAIWSHRFLSNSLKDKSGVSLHAQLQDFQLPLEDIDMLFESGSKSPVTLKTLSVDVQSNIYSLLIFSGELWLESSFWILQGGRRTYLKVPWDEESEWNMLTKKISSFNDNLGPRETLSDSNILGYASLGLGSCYCLMHLFLSMAKLMLHRDYIPFIPSRSSVPSGPLDPPKICDSAPYLWWRNSARVVFDSARSIATILHSLKAEDYCCNPFYGFSAFTAAGMLSYLHYFPNYDPEFCDSKVYYDYCLDYLSSYADKWEIGKSYHKWALEISTIYKFACRKSNRLTVSEVQSLRDKYIDMSTISDPIESSDLLNIQQLIHSNDQSTELPQDSFATKSQSLFSLEYAESSSSLDFDYWSSLPSMNMFGTSPL
ncbi:hypothetical protein KL905_003078 [Ogataea polymorpha]|nr:hypothetical protein KL937_003288 [Ogataea polymorpha]KAG7892587.1 hypothetical protein KL908_003539 [Ogataea polymorpha]KAG7900433.1 hypothetical protein KL935_003176 [Ogataea polymorpha]KAG7920444.1 hypothetical protein KL905_003078 [Ogataea polymorpha]KAG7926586.1 hypothetical protein KL925_003636 [Ogataea polymorpha]